MTCIQKFMNIEKSANIKTMSEGQNFPGSILSISYNMWAYFEALNVSIRHALYEVGPRT